MVSQWAWRSPGSQALPPQTGAVPQPCFLQGGLALPPSPVPAGVTSYEHELSKYSCKQLVTDGDSLVIVPCQRYHHAHPTKCTKDTQRGENRTPLGVRQSPLPPACL